MAMARQVLRVFSRSMETVAVAAVAAAADYGRRRRGNGTGRGDIQAEKCRTRCFYFKQVGHWAGECPNKPGAGGAAERDFRGWA